MTPSVRWLVGRSVGLPLFPKRARSFNSILLSMHTLWGIQASKLFPLHGLLNADFRVKPSPRTIPGSQLDA